MLRAIPNRDRSTKAGARTPATLAEILPTCGHVRRSTKAGARTPATLASRTSTWMNPRESAQRRPGREPRRHWRERGPGGDLRVRSTKAGARTPATRADTRPSFLRRRPLNEGRGANPGDTFSCNVNAGMDSSTLNEGRGANPGDTRPAERGPCRRSQALNEGRGANPGDTCVSRSRRTGSSFAQRRPGREPRRHPFAWSFQQARPTRSTKAGARTPATLHVR